MLEKAPDGGRKPRVSDEELLDVFRETVDPVLSTAEVAEALPIKRRGTLNRLRRLQEGGHLASKQIGGRNTVWWLTDEEKDGGRREAAEAPREDDHDAPVSPTDDGMDGEHEPATAGSEAVAERDPRMATGDTLADLVDDVAEETLPGSGAKLDERKEAFRAVVGYLREHGTVTPAELREDVYPDHDGGYTNGKDPARSWWKNAMYPALAELAKRSDEIGKADQSGSWSYHSES